MFIVSLPFGVLHGGYWGIAAMVGFAHICCHTGKILVECLYEEQNGELVRVRTSYKEVAQEHLSKDTKALWEDLEPTIQLMNRISKQMVKTFNLGDENKCDRISKATTVIDTNLPPVLSLEDP